MSGACGIILGGGRGARFGGPKAFAVLPDGRSFLATCHAVLVAAACDPIVATLPPDAGAAVPAGLLPLPLPADGLEMIDSLRLALGAVLDDDAWQTAVVLPVDHPLVAPATVVALRDRHVRAAVPRFAGKRGHPVAIGREVALQIVHASPPPATLRDVLHAAGIVDVDVDDRGVVANCNTPAALAAAWERWTAGREAS